MSRFSRESHRLATAISDVGNVKLTDGQLATGSWNDGTNVGFINNTDNGNPQPQVTFDLGSSYDVATVDIWTVSAFLEADESISISSSADGVSFSTPVNVDPIVWTDGFTNSSLRQGSIDVSSLPDGRYIRVEVFDLGQWMMINEVQFDGTAAGPDNTPPTLASSDIVDDQSGGPALQNSLITYAVTFSEDMDDTTVDATDFGDAGGDVSISIGTITETSPGVFTVEVTPTSTGTLELQINPSAVLKDAAGNNLVTTSAIVDDTSITIDPPDTTDPTLAGTDIVDNQSGGPVDQNSLITYTVTFSEDIDESTVDASDFGDAGSDASITVGTITETSPGVFEVQVTPTTTGTLELEVVAGAVIEDPSGNDLDTTAAITDDTSLVITAISSSTLLSIDFNHSASPTEAGFTGQNSSGVSHSTATGDITVSFSGQQGTFDRGASGGTNNDLYRDFIFDNNGGSPDMTITLSGIGISPSTNYELTFYAYDSGDSTRKTGISGITGTTGTTLGPVISQGTGDPDTLDEYAVTGTFTSDSNGDLTFGIDGLPNGNERTVINGFQLVGQISGGGDTTPPVWSGGYPQVDSVTATGATALAKIDEDGTGYFVVVADSAAAPSSAQIKAGNDAADLAAIASGSIALTSNIENTAAISGLTAGTAYDVYFVAEDGEPNLQTTPEKVDITTLTLFAAWGGGVGFDVDTNGDGINNGLAFLLGAADPNADATGLLPTVSESGGDLVLTFSMLNAANRGSASMATQHSSDLGATDAWDAAGNQETVPEGPGTGIVVGVVSFDVTANGALNDVVATIPGSEGSAGKLFGRLLGTE